MATNKTLSIRDDDLVVWERAARAAEAGRVTLSSYVTNALVATMPDMDTITVYVSNPRPHKEQFEGRWIVQPDDTEHLPDNYNPDNPKSWAVGIAETARGRFALYLSHHTSIATSELRVYDTAKALLKDVAGDPRVPSWITEGTLGAAMISAHTVVWRDI